MAPPPQDSLVEVPALVAMLVVPGWLLLEPFFLMAGVAASLVAAIQIDRRRRTFVPEPTRGDR